MIDTKDKTKKRPGAGKSYPTLRYLLKERSRMYDLITEHENKIVCMFHDLIKRSDVYFDLKDVILEISACKGLYGEGYYSNSLSLLFAPEHEHLMPALASHMSLICKSNNIPHHHVENLGKTKLRIVF